MEAIRGIPDFAGAIEEKLFEDAFLVALYDKLVAGGAKGLAMPAFSQFLAACEAEITLASEVCPRRGAAPHTTNPPRPPPLIHTAVWVCDGRVVADGACRASGVGGGEEEGTSPCVEKRRRRREIPRVPGVMRVSRVVKGEARSSQPRASLALVS